MLRQRMENEKFIVRLIGDGKPDGEVRKETGASLENVYLLRVFEN